jgi:hypothetical protein
LKQRCHRWVFSMRFSFGSFEVCLHKQWFLCRATRSDTKRQASHS